ncbi:MAG: hypothetical protein ACD_18C00176G0002 [uncultured bacterium]|nr:MAG: hypothetical protein ACD_18C00176G0002 [uncultured bacterium]
MNQGGGQLRRKDILYPELSYIINGALFDVFRQMGGGHKEKYYQKAVSLALSKRGLKFQEQFYVPAKFDNIVIGKYYLDFLIEEKIVLELKRGNIYMINNIDQVKEYLSALNLKLAIIASFTFNGVKTNRILNEY